MAYHGPMPEYSVGDTVQYRTFDDSIRTVKVTAREADIKNCKPGFIGETVNRQGWEPASVWGYDHQITSVTVAGR